MLGIARAIAAFFLSILFVAIVLSLLPTSCTTGCDVCGVYRGHCSEFSIQKNSDEVIYTDGCKSSRDNHGKIQLKFHLERTDNDGEFRLVSYPENSSQIPFKVLLPIDVKRNGSTGNQWFTTIPSSALIWSFSESIYTRRSR